MYLLNPNAFNIADKIILFTFHYVSIKSFVATHFYQVVTKFTFHYVSIKSKDYEAYDTSAIDLHSTMYLLNHL